MTTNTLPELERIYHDLRAGLGALQTVCDAVFSDIHETQCDGEESGSTYYQASLKSLHSSLGHLRSLKEAIKAGTPK
ncbi:hypothetical protein WDW86_11930 [Bdellovibrionota bacterium FG-2]